MEERLRTAINLQEIPGAFFRVFFCGLFGGLVDYRVVLGSFFFGFRV